MLCEMKHFSLYKVRVFILFLFTLSSTNLSISHYLPTSVLVVSGLGLHHDRHLIHEVEYQK